MRTIRVRPQRAVRRFHATPIPRHPSENSSNAVPSSPRPNDGESAAFESRSESKNGDAITPTATSLGDIAERAAALSKEIAEQDEPASNGTREKVAELRERLRQVRQEALNYAVQVDRLNRRTGRTRRSRRTSAELQNVELPRWFIERNVTLCDDLKNKALTDFAFNHDNLLWWNTVFPEQSRVDPKDIGGLPSRYIELMGYLAGSFAVAEARGRQPFSNSKSHLSIYHEESGVVEDLNSLVQIFAGQLDADLIRLDAQDLAELASEFVVSDSSYPQDNINNLGYDTYHQEQTLESAEEEEAQNDESDAPDVEEPATKGKGM